MVRILLCGNEMFTIGEIMGILISIILVVLVSVVIMAVLSASVGGYLRPFWNLISAFFTVIAVISVIYAIKLLIGG